jgi:hypothetical protein
VGHRDRVRRLGRKTRGEVIEIEQRDGSTRSFPAKTFWSQLMLDQIDAATSVVPDSPVAEAMAGATPKARERIEKIAASGRAGDFLRGGNGEDEPGLLEVAADTEDLSEQG